MAYYVSSGFTSDGIILINDNLYVLNGGEADNIQVKSGGGLTVSGGGVANGILVDGSGGGIIVSSGGTLNDTLMNSGSLVLYGGATASNVVVSVGRIRVFSGGDADQVTVHFSATLSIDSGGTATGIRENGGCVDVQGGASATFLPNTFSGLTLKDSSQRITVHSGTTANDIDIQKGTLSLYNGGVLNGATVVIGNISAFSGAVANDLTLQRESYTVGTIAGSGYEINGAILDGGRIYLADGTANDVVINSQGILNLSGGTANGTVINNGGSFHIFSGGTANGTVINSGTELRITGGIVANSTTVHYNGQLFVSSGGTATEILENGGYVEIQDGASATFQSNTLSDFSLTTRKITVHSGTTVCNATINRGGQLLVFSGGEVNDTIFASEGALSGFDCALNRTTVSGVRAAVSLQNGTVNSTTLESGGNLSLNSGTVDYTIVNNNCNFVLSNGTADHTVVNSNGYFYLTSGTADHTVVNSNGYFILTAGAANDTTVSAGGRLGVTSGGTANRTDVLSGGGMTIANGGTADHTVIHSGASIGLSSGAVMNSTMINSGGKLIVSNGGIANVVDVSIGGNAVISSGGTATEILENGGYVDVQQDASAFFVSHIIIGLVVSSGKPASLHSGTTANSAFISSGGALYLFGGEANNTFIPSSGGLIIYAGAANSSFLSGGYFTMMDGIAIDTVVDGNGRFSVNNGSANGVIISRGNLYVAQNGTAERITVLPDGSGSIYGSVNDLTLSGGWISLCNGGVATDMTVLSGGSLILSSAATASGLTISSGGKLIVSKGGAATVDFVPFECSVEIEEGGRISIANQSCYGVYYGSGMELVSHDQVIEEQTLSSGFSAYVLSGGTLCSSFLSNGKTYVFGGLLESTRIRGYYARTYLSGGTANGMSVGSAASFIVCSGGTALNTRIEEYGNVTVDSGGFADCVTFDGWCGLTIASGGAVNNANLNYACRLVVSGGMANEIVLSASATLTISAGGSASGVTAKSRSKLIIGSGADVRDLVLANGVSVDMSVTSDTYVRGIKNGVEFEMKDACISNFVIDSDSIRVLSGALAIETTVNFGGQLVISSGGSAVQITENGGYVDIMSGAKVEFKQNTFSGLTLTSASATIHSGTTAQDVTLNSRGNVIIYSGGSIDGVKINSGGYFFVSSGATATNVDWMPCNGNFGYDEGAYVTFASEYSGVFFGNGGTLLSSAQAMESKTVDYGYSMFVLSGGTADSITVASNGVMYAYGGGVINGATVNANARLIISSGATALNIVENGGIIDVQDGAAATFIPTVISSLQLYGGMTLHSGTTAYRCGASKITAFNGGLIDGGGVKSGGIMVLSGGTARNLWFEYNSLQIYSGGTATSVYGGYHGMMYVNDGGTISNVNIGTGSYLGVKGGVANSVTIAQGGIFVVSSGGTVNHAVFGQYVNITALSGATYNDVILSGGGLVVSSGAFANGITLSGGKLDISAGAVVNDVTLCYGGWLIVSSGALVSGLTLSQDYTGSLAISSGATVLGIVETGQHIDIREGATVTFTPNAFSSCSINNATIHSGTTAVSVTLFNAAAHVYDGGLVTDLTIQTPGTLYVSSGGEARNVNVSERGCLYVSDGGRVSGILLSGGGSLTLTSGGTADGLAFEDIRSYTVSSGTTALNIVENGGWVEVQDGASATFVSHVIDVLTVDSRVNATIHSGTTANSVIVSEGRKLVVYSGGLAVGVDLLNKGSMTVLSGGTITSGHVSGYLVLEQASADALTVAGGAVVSAGQANTIRNMTILSGGSLSIDDARFISDITVEAGAFVNGFRFAEQRILESGLEFSSVVVSSGSHTSVRKGQNATDVAVINGGTLSFCDGAVASGKGVTVSSGGIFSYETGEGSSETRILLKYGAMVNRIQLLQEESVSSLQEISISGGVVTSNYYSRRAFVSSGQTASDIHILGSGILEVLDGAKVFDLTASANGTLFASSGSILNGITVQSGANFQVMEDASGNDIMLSSGARINGLIAKEDTIIPVLEKFVFHGMVSAGNAGNIRSGQTASGVLIDSRGAFHVSGGASAIETVANGTLYVSSGGTAYRTTVNSNGTATVSSGGILNETTVNAGGALIVSSGGSASVIFNPWQGAITVGSDVDLQLLERDANVYVGGDSAGLVDRADSFGTFNLTSGNSAIVYADGIANGVYVNDGAALHVLSGGTAVTLYTPWNDAAEISAEDGAFVVRLDRDANVYCGNRNTGVLFRSDAVEDITVSSGNSLIVYADGIASDVFVRQFGSMNVESGGMAENIGVDGNGVLFVSSGAVVTVAYNPWGGTVLTEDGADVSYLERDANIYCGGKSTGLLQKGDVIVDYNISSGESMIVYEGGIATHANVNDSGIIEILSGGTAEIAFNPWHGSMFVAEGGTITHLDREYNVYYGGSKSGLVSSADEMDGLMITSGNSAIVYSGGVVRNVTTDTYGFLLISSGGLAENVSGFRADHNNGGVRVEAGGIISSAFLLRGTMRVAGTAKDVVIGNRNVLVSPYMMVMEGGYAENVSITERGSALIYTSGTVRDMTVNWGAYANIWGEAILIDIRENGYVNLNEKASVSDLKVSSGGGLSVSKDVSFHNAELDSGCIVNGFVLQQDMKVEKSLVVTSVTVKSLATARQDQDFSCVNVFGNARLVIESRGICRHVDVRTDGAIEMKNDGFAMDVTFSSGGRFNGIMFVNETHFDTLTDIVIDGGFVGKNPDNPNQTLQGATVFAGQTANHTTIDATATLTVNSGGKVSRTIVSGNLNVTWYGTAYDTVVQSNGYVKVMETGNIDGITVLSGGVLRSEQHESGSVDNLHIMSGGALESSYLRYGKSFVFDEGAILRGNIWNMANLTFAGTVDNSAAFITLDFSRRNASDGIMLGNIASLNNANMDLIVDSRQPHDSYAIASGAADFSGTITLRNTDGIMYGQLSLSRSRFVYNTEEYTLTLNESNELYLNISRYIPEADVILLYKRGQFVGSVESAYEVTVPVDEYEHMFVTSGGLVEGTEILSSGALTILEGGSALETHVGNNGEMNVLKGGTATDIYLDQKARLNIVEGSVDDITEINTWQANNINIFVTSGGTACNVSSARISLAAGGKLLSGTIDSANVSSGGLMEDVSVKGRITVYDGGVVSNASFAGDPATVSSGGLLSVGLISGATVYLSGGTGVELTMTSGALQVFSGGTASDAVLNVTYNSSAYAGRWYFGFFGHAFVSEGGVALHTRITGGTQLVLSGGVASRTELVSMGSEIVSDGAESIDAELTRGGKLFIRGGGVARNVYAQRNGAIIVSRFGVAESAVLESNNIMLVSSEGIVSDTLVKSGGKLYLREGAVMNGHLQAEDGAVIMVYDGATIDFDLSKGNSNTPFIDNFKAISGNPDFTVTIAGETDAGVYLLAYGADGFSGSISVQDDTLCYGVLSAGNMISFGRNTYRLDLSDGVLSMVVAQADTPVETQGEPIAPKTVHKTRLYTGETLVVSGRDSYYETVIYGHAFMDVLGGGLAESTDVTMGGVLTVGSGGTAVETHLSSGRMEILSGAAATDVYLDKGGTLLIKGGTVNRITNFRSDYWQNSPVLTITENGLAANVTNAWLSLADGGKAVSGTVINARVSSGGHMESIVVSGTVDVYDNGKLFDNTVSSGTVFLYSGGYASRTTLRNTQNSSASAFLRLSGGVAEGITIIGGTVYVYSGGTARDVSIQREYIKVGNSSWWIIGNMMVSDGGAAYDTVITGGTQTILSGGVASRTETASAGSQVVSSGGKAVETTLTHGGRLNISRGGVAEGIHANLHAAIVVDSYGTASAVELNQYNMLVASRNCFVLDATIRSGGEAYLYRNAVLGGHVLIEDDGFVMAYDNSIVDFDLSKAGSDVPLFNDLSLILGNPDYTLTISTDVAPGTYLLAGGAADFDRSITVQNDPIRYGTLTVGGSLAVGWNTYTLNLTDGMLFLTATRNDEEASTGEIIVKKTVYDAEIHTSETFNVASGFSYCETIVSSRGHFITPNGAFAGRTEIESGGRMTVQSGASVLETNVAADGLMDVLSAASVEKVSLGKNGILNISGGTVSVVSGGSVFVTDNGTADNVNNAFAVLTSGGRITSSFLSGAVVSSGCTVESTLISSGRAILHSGATANHITLYKELDHGEMIVSGGGAASNIDIWGGRLVLSGGSAENMLVYWGECHVLDGGTATGADLRKYKNLWSAPPVMTVSSGLASQTKIAYGSQTVQNGGTAVETLLSSRGSQSITNGGLAFETTLSEGGMILVSHGGIASNVHAARDGAVIVSRQGLADDVTIDAFNMMAVSRAGSAANVTVKSGGELYLYKEAVLGGRLRFENGAVVSAYEGALVTFDLALADASTPLIDNLSAISGAPSYVINVSADMTAGVYLLANCVADFGDTITVRDDSMRLGKLSLTNPLVCGWNTYTLNLENAVLSLTVSANESYQEPEPEEEEPEETETMVSSGSQMASPEPLVWEKTGDILRVASGGILKDTEIPWGGTLILEEDAILRGTLRLGTDVLVNGEVDAANANIVFDISNRKEEYGVQLDHLTYVEAKSYSVLVSPDQNKGEYILAGNAEGFTGTITVRNTAGVNCGELSSLPYANCSMDYDVTRYTLCLSENNELVLIVTSNITNEADYILLYKNGRLVLARPSADDLLISSQKGKYDQMIVLSKGLAERVRLGYGGHVTVQKGGTLILSEQTGGGLVFDYDEGDDTVIKGFNLYGAFFVKDNVLENVMAKTVNVSGNILIHNYHGQSGRLTTKDGVEVTGIGDGGMSYYSFSDTWIHDFAMSNAGTCVFADGTVLQNTEWEIPGILERAIVKEDVLVENTVFNAPVELYGGTLSDVAFSGMVEAYSYILVKGDLSFMSSPMGGYFDMNGHTASFDFRYYEGDENRINRNSFSEDTVFSIRLQKNQLLGTYGISNDNRGPYVFRIDDTTIGTIDENNPCFIYGLYSYTMNNGDLIIDIADDSDGTYNYIWYDTEGDIYHAGDAEEVTIAGDTNPLMIIRKGGRYLHRSTLADDGLLRVCSDARVIGLNHQMYGKLRFNYNAGETTRITGINPYGSFFVTDDAIENVYGENVTVSGEVTIRDYHGYAKTSKTGQGNVYGTLTTQNGVSVTGKFSGGYYNFSGTVAKDFVLDNADTVSCSFSGSIIDHVVLNGGNYSVSGSTASHGEFNVAGGFGGGSTVSQSVFNGYVSFSGAVYVSDIEINGRYYLGNKSTLNLLGDITLNSEGKFEWDSCVNVNGHTVTVNYKDRNVTDKGMFSVSNFSEDVNFRLLFQKDQKIGRYTIAYNAGSFVDYFLLNIGGVDTEELSFENTEMDYGNYHYVMAHDVETQLITLDIDISENADETFNVYYWDSAEEEFYHYASVDGVVLGTDDYHSMIVRNHGLVRQSELNDGELITVHAGGEVVDLLQNRNGRLRFDYAFGDATTINGINPYGSFFVENNRMENVLGESITVSGGVVIQDYHSLYGGTLTATDAEVTGRFEGEGTFFINGCTVYDFESNDGQFYFQDGTTIKGSTLHTSRYYSYCYDCFVEDSFVDYGSTYGGTIYLSGGTYSNVLVNTPWTIGKSIELDGDITFSTGSYYNVSVWDNGVILGNGHTVSLDLSNRNPIYQYLSMIYIDRIRNAELRIIMDQRQPVGTYEIGSFASNIGQGDATGVYDWDTNKWLFKGETIGDLDGVISIYDVNGIELANCTVNGDTEYYGRCNYTVFVDEKGILKLKVGWNNREQGDYEADALETNDTRETATELSGGGVGTVSNLTIHTDSDVDWFKFELQSFGRKSSYIGIDFKQWPGDLDINLYNANGELIDYARSVTNNERLSLSGHTAGTYYLKVYGCTGNTNAYKLVYDLPEPIDLTDDYESGDGKEHAYFLKRLEETITIDASISRGDDSDYYMFILPERGLVSDVITLTYDDEFGDLDLYLYDQNGKDLLVSSTNTVGGQERVTLAGLKHGVYYAAVKSKDGSVGRYRLVFNVNDRDVNPDKYENNNAPKKATNLYTLNGEKTLEGLSVHSDTDVDYYRFTILEKGSADDFITLSSVASLGDLDIEILNVDGDVVAYSRTAEDEDTVSLKDLDAGEYYIRVYGCNNVANNYSLSWHVTNSSLIPPDEYEGHEPIPVREDQTISGLSIAKVREADETREDTFKIVLEYDAWKRSKIILTDYRGDWEDGLSYVIKDADGNVLMEGIDSEISLYGLTRGEYYLTLDAPNEDEYSEYSLIAQCLPDSDVAKDNTWSIFIYMAGDNNLEAAYLQELLYMQKAILPENVEVYVLLDRSEKHAVAERNWTDTRVGRIRHSSGGAVAVQWMYFDGINTDTYMNTHNLELRQEWDTGDIATLEAFLDWGMKEGRADNYALIIKDHGNSLGFNCHDEKSDSIMAISEIAELLKADKYKDLSVVAFDQCLMGSDVVITTMEGTVDYVLASEAVGYTPNWLVMYKVLLNSFETDMTPQELSRKIVDACNCSGLMDLTMASFNSGDNTLSEALNLFGETTRQFTFSDWIVLCKCYSKVRNYGDNICAYTDLGNLLNMIRGYRETISTALLDAVNSLYDIVMNTVIDSTMITPETYGTGLAVFNPVRSDPTLSAYTYGGREMNFFDTSIGKGAWGEYVYTLSKLVDECSDYIVEGEGKLTFTSFTYFCENGEIKTSCDLGAFSGNGVSFEGLYLDDSAYFNVTLERAGIQGDAIVVTADNPNAEIKVSLVQTTELGDSQVRRVSENGVLSLAGVNFEYANVLNDYTLIVTCTEETTFDLKFVSDWTTGVDFFDYSRTGSISPLAAGNNSIDKATQLPNGNYGGLVTCAGDKDFYKILSVYADTVDVTVKGTGLVVQEFNADGEIIRSAKEEKGLYKLTVGKNNYVCVEGTADISNGECDPYVLSISDAAQTYIKAELDAMLPEKPVVTTEFVDNQVAISVSVDEGLRAFYSKDMFSWTEYGSGLVATENGRYFFKAVNTESGLESQYATICISGIPPVSDVDPQSLTWEEFEDAEQYVVEYTADDFEHVIRVAVYSHSIDSFRMPAGNYQLRVKAAGDDEWTVVMPVEASAVDAGPKVIRSVADDKTDLFFANPDGTWEPGYLAQHAGSIGDWNGTGEYAKLFGKNKLTDIIEGSTDANILLMTDLNKGDALFVDDIYSALPGSVAEHQARIARIDEIRAGAGNDIVDMTSQRFEYAGDGLTIRGGDGNDTIWANKGDNLLFGDAGNDRIVGASGNDVIAGCIGNDRMHGGGGDDVFTFCENWGVDNVEQLATGSVTLWFASGSLDNWDEATLTYTDGENIVKVSGVTAEKVTLKFGDDGSAQFASLTNMGAFLDATSERIFEESGKGILASL